MTALVITAGILLAALSVGYRVRTRLRTPDVRPVPGSHRAEGPPQIFGSGT